jgi:hypothetical protein
MTAYVVAEVESWDELAELAHERYDRGHRSAYSWRHPADRGRGANQRQ